MRNLLHFILAVTFLFSVTPAFSQNKPIKTNPRTIKTVEPVKVVTPPVKQEVPVKVVAPQVVSPKIEAVLAFPDLVVEAFTITGEGTVSGGQKSFSFRAVIKNNGTADAVGPFWFGPEVKAHNSQHFYRTANIRIDRLNAGESRVIMDVMLVNVASISEHVAEARGYVDNGGTEEFPQAYMHVSESNENNNYSDIVMIGGTYTPSVVAIHPQNPVNKIGNAASGEQVYISGQGFGQNANGAYGVAAFPLDGAAGPVLMNITNWYNGVIYFTIPKSVDAGYHHIAIVDRNTMAMYSAPISVLISHRADFNMSVLTSDWNDWMNAGVRIRIHNWGGNSDDVVKESYIEFVGVRDSLDLDRIQFHTAVGDYRYFINDLGSLYDPGNSEYGITLHRISYGNVYVLPNNALRMQIAFESSGFEAKGYWDALGGGRHWQDWGGPDIDIDDAVLGFTFEFSYNNGMLDYTIPAHSVYFNADVDAHDAGADFAMDLFMGGWDSMVTEKVTESVRLSLMEEETRRSLCESFMMAFRMNAGLNSSVTIQKIDFNHNIEITYH